MKAPTRLGIVRFSLMLALPGASVAKAVELAGFFGGNMVLQRSAHTVVWGAGGTNQMRVWVRYGPAIGEARADAKGNWRIELDLSKPAFGPPDTLTLRVGKRRSRPVLELTNVAVGRVWLVAGWQEKGVRLPTVGNLNDFQPRVRFLSLARSARAPAWGPYQSFVEAQGSNAFALHLAQTLAESGYVGIVQTTPQDLEHGLDPSAAAKAFLDPACVQRALPLANKDVQEFEANRYERLVQNKRNGVVLELPGAFEYAPPLVYAPLAFSSGSLPAAGLTFEAAVWPGPAQK